MDVAELVRTVVREVLERTTARAPKACVMVYAERSGDLERTIREQLDTEAEILFSGEEPGERSFERHILPVLSCCDMADLASGRASGPLMSEILRLLLRGAEVEVLDFEYKSHALTAPGPLYRLYEAHEQTLASYGLIAFRHKQPDEFRAWEDLVTAATVEQAHQKGAVTLLIPLRAKVTPLAAEAAANMNITILKRL